MQCQLQIQDLINQIHNHLPIQDLDLIKNQVKAL
jgi:hypothetical protein